MLRDVGLDVKYGVTGGLNLDLTVNTDFAQAEVDEQQVNLTRFSLFFPEKRDFFLENAGLFNDGHRRHVHSTTVETDLFFSRRIGLVGHRAADPDHRRRAPDREGRAAQHRVIDIQTDDAFGRPGENFLVGALQPRRAEAVAGRRDLRQQGGARRRARTTTARSAPMRTSCSARNLQVELVRREDRRRRA